MRIHSFIREDNNPDPGRQMKKGSVLAAAALAGISAAKQCGHLIPLCHNILLNKADVTFEVHKDGIEACGIKHLYRSNRRGNGSPDCRQRIADNIRHVQSG